MANSAQRKIGYRDIVYNIYSKQFFSLKEGDNYEPIDTLESGINSGGTADRPTDPNAGDIYYDTDINQLIVFNGNNWEIVGGGGGGSGYWALSGNDLKPLDDTYDVEIGGGNIELNADGIVKTNNGVFYNTTGNAAQDREGNGNKGYSGFYVDQAAGTTGVGITSRLTSAEDPIGARLSLNRYVNNSTSVQNGDVLGEISSSGGQGSNTPRNSSKIRMVVDGNPGNQIPGAIEFMTATSGGTPSNRARITSSGHFLIGGTLPSSPNISLNSDGSAEFAGLLKAGTIQPLTPDSAAAPGLTVYNDPDTGFFRAVSNCIGFATAGVERARILGNFFRMGGTESAPNVELRGSTGSAAFAGSVSIGGTAAANTIDEYEEGTCTVDLTVGGSPAGLTGTDALGTYTRIGNLCQVQISLSISSASVSGKSGLLAITGLPIASQNSNRSNFSSSVCNIINWATEYADGSETILATNSANSTTLALVVGSRSTGQLDETALDFTSGTCKIYTTFIYRIA